MVFSCADDDTHSYDYSVTIHNDLNVDIYVTDNNPDIIDVLLNNYHLESGESIWLSWSSDEMFYDYVEIEAYHRECFIEVSEGFHEDVRINDEWIEDYCPE